MEKNVKELEKAEKVAEYQAIAEHFIAISEEHTDQWLPLYYVAYCYLNTVFSEEPAENIDMVLEHLLLIKHLAFHQKIQHSPLRLKLHSQANL